MPFFRALARSCYDLSFYHALRARETGLALGLITGLYALLVGLGLLVAAIAFHVTIMRQDGAGEPPRLDRELQHIASQWPRMQIENNKVSVEGEQPVTIRLRSEEEGKGFALLTIDTTGATTHANMRTPLLLTDRDVVTKNKNETEIQSLSEWLQNAPQPMTLDAERMGQKMHEAAAALHRLVWFIYPAFWVLGMLVFVPMLLIMRLCLLLPLALAGQLAARLMGEGFSYAAAIRVMGTALVPLTLVDVLSSLLLGSGVSVWLKAVVGVGVVVLVCATNPEREARSDA